MTIQTQNVTTLFNLTNPTTAKIRAVTCENLYLSNATGGGITVKVAAAVTFAFVAATWIHPLKWVNTGLALTNTITPHTASYPSLAEHVNFYSVAYRTINVTVNEHIALTNPVHFTMYNGVVGKINIKDAATPVGHKTTSVATGLNFSALVQSYREMQVSEHINLTATPSYTNYHALNVASSTTFNFTNTILHGKLTNNVVAYLALTTPYTTKVKTTPWVYEHIALSNLATYPVTYTGWWMNSATTAMTHFDNLPFTSMAVINGRIFGMGAAGLYELTGDNDNGANINAYATSGYSTLGIPQLKRITDVFVTGWSESTMQVTATVDGANSGDYTYTIPQRDMNQPRGNRVALGKGLNSTYWKFSLANQNGGNFAIDSMDADVSPSTNRRV